MTQVLHISKSWLCKSIISTVFVFLLLPIGGCYTDIDLDKYRDEKISDRIVINSILTPDSAMTAVATHPYFFTDKNKTPSFEKDLELRGRINGREEELLLYNEKRNRYISCCLPEQGDIITLSTLWKGKPVVATDTIPYRVNIEDMKVVLKGPVEVYGSDGYIIDYEVTFTDPANEDNFYFLSFGGPYDMPPWDSEYVSEGERVYENEFVFQVLSEIINKTIPGWEPYSLTGLPFSDKGIEGKRHTLHISEIMQHVWYPDKYIGKRRSVTLYSISQAYYNFMLSLLLNDPDDDSLHGSFLGMGLIEPDRLFSNVEGGTGILCSYVLDKRDAFIK